MLTAGSDVTWDQTAEIWRPPYLSLGPQPEILEAPSFARPGEQLAVPYSSADPVARAILIRNGAVTHSMSFGERLQQPQLPVRTQQAAVDPSKGHASASGRGVAPEELDAVCAAHPHLPCPCLPCRYPSALAGHRSRQQQHTQPDHASKQQRRAARPVRGPRVVGWRAWGRYT